MRRIERNLIAGGVIQLHLLMPEVIEALQGSDALIWNEKQK